MHGHAGLPPSMSTSSSHQPSSSNTAPPIPARRLASHPATTPNSGGGGAGVGAGKVETQLSVGEKDTAESRSAPSSPTEKETDITSNNLRPERVTIGTPRATGGRSPSAQRPRSVVVDMSSASGLNYAQVHFTNGHGGKRPRVQQRRNTKYTSIAYQPENSAGKKSRDEPDGQGNAETENSQQQHQQASSSSASGRNSDHNSHRHSSSPRDSPVPPSTNVATTTENASAMYDVPPPIPMRKDLVDSEEGSGSSLGQASSGSGEGERRGGRGGGEGGREEPPIAPHCHHSSDPFHSSDGIDPFDGGQADPFGAMSVWKDPTGFYDTPPQRLPNVPARNESTNPPVTAKSTVVGIEAFADSFVDPGDCTGDSSYEDTGELLKLRFMKMKAMGGGTEHYAPASDVYTGPDKTKRMESHESDEGIAGSPELDQKPSDGYEFPAELTKYPFTKEANNQATPSTVPEAPPTKLSDQPTLHVFNYSSSKAQATCPVPSSGQPVARHESFGRSARNMPLPPIPGEAPPPSQHNLRPQATADHAPPLPARPDIISSKPPLPGNHPSMRKQQVEERPKLPPPNLHNRRHPIENTTPSPKSNPPLPPRNTEAQSGGKMGGAAPPQSPPQRKEDRALQELFALGYSKAEIERALKITKNDYSMAKEILQEYGGRH